MAAAWLWLAPGAPAQTLRVTTWNLDAPLSRQTNGTTIVTNTLRVPAAARALKQLNPDVILLQQIRDWTLCDELAKALKPAVYTVAACSAFQDPRTGEPRKQQVAILAKSKPYFSWTEPWRATEVPALPGGYAFAAFQVGKQQVGVFSVQAPRQNASTKGKALDPAKQLAQWNAAGRQLLAQVGSVSNWVANRVQVFVIGGTFGTVSRTNAAVADTPLRLLEDAGFGDAFLELSGKERLTLPGRAGAPGSIVDYLYTQPAGCTTGPRIVTVNGFRHRPASCEIGFGPAAALASQEGLAQATLKTPAPKSVSAAKPAIAPAPAAAPMLTKGTNPPARTESKAETTPVPATTKQTATAVVAPSERPHSLQALWLGVAGAMGAALVSATWILMVVWRRRFGAHPAPALLTAGGELPSSYTVVVGTRSATDGVSASPTPLAPQPIIQVEAGVTQTQTEALRQRAQAAEERAAQAQEVIRRGLIPHLSHWFKHKLVHRLIADRSQLLQTQQAAARKALAVEQRLARIEQQVQQQNKAYQTRIEELTYQLLNAKEENRELIRSRIAQVRAEMETARQRLVTQAETDANRAVKPE